MTQIMKYFGEKESQIACGEIEAFGIKISSRYSNADELIEMFNFCKGAARLGISNLVDRIFYDSQSNCCSFEFNDDADTAEIDELKNVALINISQFEWIDGHCFGKETIDKLESINDDRLGTAQMLLEIMLEDSPFKKESLIWGAIDLIQNKSMEEKHGMKNVLSNETKYLIDLLCSQDYGDESKV
jgi:hypothetical protein